MSSGRFLHIMPFNVMTPLTIALLFVNIKKQHIVHWFIMPGYLPSYKQFSCSRIGIDSFTNRIIMYSDSTQSIFVGWGGGGAEASTLCPSECSTEMSSLTFKD